MKLEVGKDHLFLFKESLTLFDLAFLSHLKVGQAIGNKTMFFSKIILIVMPTG